MRAPAFWWLESPNAAAAMLAPFSWLWGFVAGRRMRLSGRRAGIPVVCVGNYVAGGAGKTPAAIACAALLQKHKLRPAFLSRGYGGSASRGAPLRVDSARHDSRLTGDEALLLAAHAPTIVCANRPTGAAAAEVDGADVAIMDDGLQNPSLQKDFRIAVADGESGIGNGLCLPAGPLRAPLDDQFAATDALVVLGAGEAGERLAGRARARGIPVFRARLVPDREAAEALRGRDVVAFAGIGRPEKFFATLEEAGARVVEAFSFDDHQMLDADNLRALRKAALGHRAKLATTEKDMARLRGLLEADDILVLPVSLVLEDEAGFAALMMRAISSS